MPALADIKAASQRRIAIVAGLILILILCIGTGIQARQRAIKNERTAATRPGEPVKRVNDFSRWMEMTPHFLAGDEHGQYLNDDLPNPPIILVFFGPLTALQPHDAQLAWAVFKFPLIALIMLCCLDMARRAGVTITLQATGLFVFVWIFALIGDLQEGQTNLLMLAPLVAGLWLAQRRTPKADLAAGVLIALATCIKITPLIFIAYMLYRRRWRVSIGALVGLALWLLLVPGILFGWSQNIVWIKDYAHVMILPYVTRGEVTYAFGQSLPSFLTRVLRHVKAFDSPTSTPYMNLLDLSEPLVNWIIRGVLGLIALAGAFWMRRKTPFNTPRYLLEIGAVGIVMLWASQRSWLPHFVSLSLAAAAVATVMSDPRESPRTRRFAGIALLIAGVLMALTSDLTKLFGRDGPEWAKACGVSIAASIFLLVALFRSRWAKTTSHDSSDSVRPV